MGSLSLTLYDSNDDVIGAAVVPGIKRLSPENSIREVSKSSVVQAWMPESDGNPMAESDKFFFSFKI